jgi:hypothetical protein
MKAKGGEHKAQGGVRKDVRGRESSPSIRRGNFGEEGVRTPRE